jgi:multidrug efflux pump subunit AcrA (membrane-fusion protein)
MKLRGILTILGILLVLALAIYIAKFLIENKPKVARQKIVETSALVEVQPVKSQAVVMMVEAYGTVKPRESLKLVAEVSGRITALSASFVEGAQVAPKTAIIKIDPRTYRLEVERQKSQIQLIDAEIKHLEQQVHNLNASIKIAKSDVALAKAEVARLRMLIGKNVVAQTTLDKSEQRYLGSLNQLQRLENELALTNPTRKRLLAQRQMTQVLLKQARLNLDKTTVRVPYKGWVAEKRIEVGQQVHAGEYLGRIYREGRFDVEISITAEDLVWLVDGGGTDTGWEALVATSNGGKIRTWQGRVARSKAEVDTATRTQMFVVEIDASAADRTPTTSVSGKALRLKPGTFVTVKIKGRPVPNLIVLPRHVIHDDDRIYTIADGRLRRKAVSVLRYHSEKAFIKAGLNENDLIITTPLANAFEGMKLRVNKKK